MATLARLAATLRHFYSVQKPRLLSLIKDALARDHDYDYDVDRLVDLLPAFTQSHRDEPRRLTVFARLAFADTREPIAAKHDLDDASRLARSFHLDDP